MGTPDFIEALRSEISEGLEEKLLKRLAPMIEQRLYSNVFDLKEAARYLSISESTLRRMIADREVPYFQQRGQYFFRQADLDRSIDKQVQKNYQLS